MIANRKIKTYCYVFISLPEHVKTQPRRNSARQKKKKASIMWSPTTARWNIMESDNIFAHLSALWRAKGCIVASGKTWLEYAGVAWYDVCLLLRRKFALKTMLFFRVVVFCLESRPCMMSQDARVIEPQLVSRWSHPARTQLREVKHAIPKTLSRCIFSTASEKLAWRPRLICTVPLDIYIFIFLVANIFSWF